MQKPFLNLFSVLFFAFISMFASFVFAGPSRTTYQAKIVKPDGYPLEAGTVNFKFTILDPSATCILFSETYSSVNMTNTGGLISFSLGSGVKSYPVSSTTFEQVFSNITPNMGCDTGGGAPAVYTPLASDPRKIIMQFNDGGGWQTLPAMTINAVPYAMYSNDTLKFNGKDVSDFVQVSSFPTCTASEALRYTGTAFQCVAAGGSGPITSGSVVTALGYNPADQSAVATSFTTVTSSVNNLGSSVTVVTSALNNLSSSMATVTSAVNDLSASMSAITSSQWTTSATAIYYSTGNVGVGSASPAYKLTVQGSGSAPLYAFNSSSSFGAIIRGRNNANTTGNFAGLLVQNDAAEGGAAGRVAGMAMGNSVTSSIGFVGTKITDATSGYGDLIFGTRGSGGYGDRMRIDSIGNVGIGITVPATKLDVAGGIKIGTESNSCSASLAGTLRYNGTSVEYCNGTSWSAFGVAGAGITNLNGSTSGSQTFAVGTAGTSFNVVTAGSTHTFNIPLASTATVTGGLLSNADYTTFMNKVTSSTASIAQVLGYTPANQTAMATSFTAVTNSINTNSSSLTSLTNSVTTSFSTLAASVGAITSSQWSNVGGGIYYGSGNVGIGTSTPTGKLEIQATVSNTTLFQVNSSMTHSTVTSGSYGVVGLHTWVKPGASTGAVNAGSVYGVANRILRNTTAGVDDNGTQSNFYGEHIAFGHSNVGGASPTTNSMAGLYLDPQLGAGTVVNFYSLRLATPSLTGAVVTNRWGFAQDDTLAKNYFNGPLGLGITTPVARLQITAGTSSVAPLRMTAGSLLSLAQSGTIEYDGSTFYVTDDTNTRRAIATGSTSGSVDNASNINSTSNITMTPAGSVIVSSTTASTNTSTGALIVKGGLGVAGAINANTITASSSVTAPYFLANTAALGTNAGDYVDMQRWTGNTTNVSSLELRNVRTASGTNWFSAGTRLQQKVDSTWMGYLQFNGNGNDYGISFGTGNSVVHPSSVSERMRITDIGYVGIGTSSPTKLVHVQVDQNADTALLIRNLSSGTSAMTALDLEGDANGIQLITYSANASGNWGGNTVSRTNTAALRSYTTLPVSAMLVGTGSPAPLHFMTGDAPRVTVTSAGKVGIGTLSPNDQLHVMGVMTTTSGTGNLSVIPEYLGSAYIQSYQSVGVFKPLKIDGLGLSFDAKGGQFSFTSGNVGIGSAASATYKVQITGSSVSGSAGQTNISAFTGNGLNIQGSISNNSADAITYQSGGSGGGAAIAFRRGGSYDTYIDFYTNTAGTPGAMTRQLVLNNYGYLGMGVSNPTVPLDFNLNNGYLRSQLGDGGLELGSGNDDSTYIDFHGNNNLNADFVGRIEYQDSSGFNFNVGGAATPALFIASGTKYIGMNGVTAPTSNLHIDTGISTTNYTGIKLQNAFKTWTIGNNIPNNYNNIFGIFDGTTPRMWINSNGNVGFGANNPATNLAVNSTAAGGYTIIANQNSAAGGQEWRWYSSSTGAPLGSDAMCFGVGTCIFTIFTSGNATLAGTLTQNSDVRFKRDIASIPDALLAVSKLDGVTYYWKDSTRDPNKQIGLIAQEVEKVFPEAVVTSASGYKSVAYQNLIAPVINAIKEIREWMFKTDDRVLALENARKQDRTEIDELKKQNETLKMYLCEKDPQAPVCR